MKLTKLEKQQNSTPVDAEKRMLQREIDWLKETINMRICQEEGRKKTGKTSNIIDGAGGAIRLTTNNRREKSEKEV
jgi:hypothetical protein